MFAATVVGSVGTARLASTSSSSVRSATASKSASKKLVKSFVGERVAAKTVSFIGAAAVIFTAARPVTVMASGDKVAKTEEEWKKQLSEQEYYVLRQKGTERATTGEYDKFYPQDGYFECRGCGNPLYSAASKFNSGCGWPAFDKCYKGSVKIEVDNSFGMRRVEIMCARCDGHLGHVFEGERFTDTNERHCVNSISVRYKPGNPPNALPEEKCLAPGTGGGGRGSPLRALMDLFRRR
eukprot:tig00000169_g11906.t1